MNNNFSHLEIIDAKKYAALAWALGLTRGILYEVASGQFVIEEVQKILDQTSLNALAQKIGCEEHEMAIDWSRTFVVKEIEIQLF